MKKEPKKSREIKKGKVANLAQKIAEAKSVVFADYRGLTANQIGQLRNKVKDAGGEIIISKNTLVARALQSTDYKLPTTAKSDSATAVDSSQPAVDLLSGPTATVFSYHDELAPIREIAQSQKAFGLPKFKFGFLGNDLLDDTQLTSLAKIPSRDVLYAEVVGTLASPLFGVVNVLSANIRNLVYVLDQKAKQSSA